MLLLTNELGQNRDNVFGMENEYGISEAFITFFLDLK
jgi:hypothetical protein